jgi:hypothetical protein
MRYLALASLALTLGCTMESASKSPSTSEPSTLISGPTADEARRVVPPAAPSPAGGATDPVGQVQDTSAALMIIRTGQVSIEVDSLEPAIAAVRNLASRVGGYVAGSSAQGGDRQLRSAQLELKIPAARWADVIAGLAPIGELESVREEAQDVGEEYVDVSARLTNARRLETRLIELLDRRTGKLEDVLMVERELARVREEIERYEGRLRYLRSRVATSTLVVYLHEPTPLVGAPGENVLVDAFRDSWRNFIHFLAWLISASGILIPLALLVGAGVWVAFRVRRALAARALPARAPDEKV